MLCRYINLDAAVERRAALEESFAPVAATGWRLERLRATTAAEARGDAGETTASEAACFMSHLRAIDASLEDDDVSMIVEDDVAFSPRMPEVLGRLAGAPVEWDILFTEVLISDARQLLWLAREWPEKKRANDFLVHEVTRRPVVGSSAYIVKQETKAKLLQRLRPLLGRKPYDLALREILADGAIRGFMLFPFLTTLSAQAYASQIQGTSFPQMVLTTLRRSMFLDRDEADMTQAASRIAALADPNGQLFGAIMAGMASQAFPERF